MPSYGRIQHGLHCAMARVYYEQWLSERRAELYELYRNAVERAVYWSGVYMPSGGPYLERTVDGWVSVE